MMGDMGGMNMPDMASMQAMMQQNPEMMAAMMDNPMVQQALDNPGKNRRRLATRDALTFNAQPLSKQSCKAILKCVLSWNPTLKWLR